MQNILALRGNNSVVKNSILDALGIAFVYFIPSISHMFSYPVYFFEPMRIILILALVHSTKRNTYMLALTLPLFSFITASHPVFINVVLITCEMTLNAWLFYFISWETSNLFYVTYVSIVLSKSFYYVGKLLLTKLALFNTEMIDTPLVIQFSIALILSSYVYWFMNKKKAM